MLNQITIKEYFNREVLLPLIDVRSPAEYAKGHICQAVNISLFSDDERAKVGTVYKQQSKEEAIELGYEFVTPKLQTFLDESAKVAKGRAVAVHCWRGGMRSQSFAKHLHDNGFDEVYVIEGGYKTFRNYVLDFFAQPFRLHILGGYTGSGKTYLLTELHKRGEQVIDLEGVANHKGSAFGSLGELPQPSTEHFENLLFEKSRLFDLSKPIWVEDESLKIGSVYVPKNLHNQIREQALYFLDIPKVQRAKHLVADYGKYEHADLARSINAITKRLGGQKVKNALAALDKKNYFAVAMITLDYYDKMYRNGMQRRDENKVVHIPLETVDAVKNAKILVNFKIQN